MLGCCCKKGLITTKHLSAAAGPLSLRERDLHLNLKGVIRPESLSATEFFGALSHVVTLPQRTSINPNLAL